MLPTIRLQKQFRQTPEKDLYGVGAVPGNEGDDRHTVPLQPVVPSSQPGATICLRTLLVSAVCGGGWGEGEERGKRRMSHH